MISRIGYITTMDNKKMGSEQFIIHVLILMLFSFIILNVLYLIVYILYDFCNTRLLSDSQKSILHFMLHF